MKRRKIKRKIKERVANTDINLLCGIRLILMQQSYCLVEDSNCKSVRMIVRVSKSVNLVVIFMNNMAVFMLSLEI